MALVKEDNSQISLQRQAQLLYIARSSIYYQPKGNPRDLIEMNAIDKIDTKYPFYGHRKIRLELADQYGIEIGKVRTLKLMQKMGICAIYPKSKPNTSKARQEHYKFPYLLKGLVIICPNQVWGTDITYIRLKNGFIYLVALIDWFSRYVISWQLSETMESGFCAAALQEALKIQKPEIHNSDQGVQFTSAGYINILKARNINISMDGRGRCMDNIFTEQLWRTVKQENIYLNSYADLKETRNGLKDYFQFYNHDRKHQGLGYQTPAQVYLKN